MITDLVSVLVPCYNHEKYIGKCLESIVSNTYAKIELIFVDDGSKDQSYEVANSYLSIYKNRFINLIILKQDNKGVTKTLNDMIKMSSGEFITVVASDDCLTLDSIEKRVDFIKLANCDAVMGKSFLINSEGRVISDDAAKRLHHANSLRLEKNIKKELLFRWSAVGPALMVRRNLYEKIGMYNEFLKVEDRDFYLRMLSNDSLKYLNQHVSYYRVHESNTSKRESFKLRKKMLIEICEVNILHERLFKRFSEKLYLKSYKIDSILLRKDLFKLLLIHKLIRITIINIYLMLCY